MSSPPQALELGAGGGGRARLLQHLAIEVEHLIGADDQRITSFLGKRGRFGFGEETCHRRRIQPRRDTFELRFIDGRGERFKGKSGLGEQ